MIKLKDVGSFKSIPEILDDIIKENISKLDEHLAKAWDINKNIQSFEEGDFIKIEVIKDSKNWILLFQMDAIKVDDYELMFGDSGHIYFWIKKEDLKNKNFDNVWLILQSC